MTTSWYGDSVLPPITCGFECDCGQRCGAASLHRGVHRFDDEHEPGCGDNICPDHGWLTDGCRECARDELAVEFDWEERL